MLQNHKLLIDKDCPLCRAYGTAFTNLNWIDKKTIDPYQSIADEHFCEVDSERATKEIALLDLTSKKVLYGLDAMLTIFTHNLPFLTPLFENRMVKRILKQLYLFITYNRKVIAPAKMDGQGRTCDPGVVPIYRWLYLLIGLATTISVVVAMAHALRINSGNEWTLPALVFGHYLLMGTFVKFRYPELTLEYLGNMNTVGIIGALLFTPVLILHHYLDINAPVLLISFLTIGFLLILEHKRRIKLTNLKWDVQILWAGYWVIAWFLLL